MYSYTVYGLKVKSDIEIKEFMKNEDKNKKSVEITDEKW